MKTRLQWRTQYDIAADEKAGKNTAITNNGESKTIQGAPDTDINDLMRRMGVSDGSFLPTDLGEIDPRYYGDFTETPDLRTVLETHKNAIEMFEQLPAAIRTRFGNDPITMLDWVTNKDNAEEAVKLGLLTKYEKPANEWDTLANTITTALQPKEKDGKDSAPDKSPIPGK